jgi:hypothetical protein
MSNLSPTPISSNDYASIWTWRLGENSLARGIGANSIYESTIAQFVFWLR